MRALITSAVVVLAVSGCDPSRPVRVRADAAEPTCARLFDAREDVWVETTCLPERCSAVASQEGCTFDVAITGCETGELAGTVDVLGVPTFAPSALLGECSLADDGTALVSAACVSALRSCRVDVHRRTGPRPAALTHVQILDVPFEGPSGSEAQLLDQLDPLRGYLTDAAIIGEVVAVAAHDGIMRSVDCTSPDPMKLVFVDATRATVTSSTSAPACLTRLAPDPLGPGLLGVFGVEPLVLGRFDASGVLLASAPLSVPAAARPFAVALLPGPMTTAVVVATHGFPATSFVVFADTASLEQQLASPPVEGRLRHAVRAEPNMIVASEIYEQKVLTIDGSTGVVLDVIRLATSRRVSGDAGFVVALPAMDALVVASTGARGALWVLDLAEGASVPIAGTAVFFEAIAAPWAMAPSPVEADLVLGAVTSTAPGYTARLARLDPVGPRWLPGSTVLGRGVVSSLLGRGREVWAVLPWSAALVRIELQ